MINRNYNNYSDEDYEYMNSLSSAVLERSPAKLRLILWFWVVTIIAAVTWANFAKIDEIVRGDGKVIPRSENQTIQNLEGGIVNGILVKEGDIVKKGQILIKIDNQKSKSNYDATYFKSLELTAKIIRLTAEANNLEFKSFDGEEIHQYLLLEKSLHERNQLELNSKIDVLKEQVKQKENDLAVSESKVLYLIIEDKLIQEEIEIGRPLVEKKIRSKVSFLKLQREASNIKKELSTLQISIPKIDSLITEAQSKIQEAKDTFSKEAQEKLNEATAELERVYASMNALEDQVSRTNVYSSTNGIIQKVFFNTIGGVIKPGEDLIEIVPTGETLLIEAKIKPADIAFIYFKQQAKVKFTAYDFALYGSLDGHIIKISADTEVDEDNQSHYTVLIQTTQNQLMKGDKELPIIPGMIVNVDILTGKKTVLDYILKPILRAKEYTFTER